MSIPDTIDALAQAACCAAAGARISPAEASLRADTELAAAPSTAAARRILAVRRSYAAAAAQKAVSDAVMATCVPLHVGPVLHPLDLAEALMVEAARFLAAHGEPAGGIMRAVRDSVRDGQAEAEALP